MASTKLNSKTQNGSNILNHFSKKIAELSNHLDHHFDETLRLICECQGKLVFCGLGKSGHVARLICSSFQSIGCQTVFLHGSEANHGDMGIIDPEKDLVIYFSFSGKSPELENTISTMKPKHSILITGNTTTTFAKMVSIALDIHVKDQDEAWPIHKAPSTSIMAMLAIAYALMMCVAHNKSITLQDFSRFHPGGYIGLMLSKTVLDILRPVDQLPLVKEQSSLIDILPTMTSYLCGCVIIIDEADRIQGIFTDGDLRRVTQKSPELSIPIHSVMTRDFTVCPPNMLAANALDLMEQKKITSLIVMENNQFRGLVHIHDILRSFS
ncbi:MAG: hypothetical protein CMF42_02650 [Legionellales bacterium]|nr:hypothetical protein [Legionellales bacterium]OUX67676.1 MAG: hypothetical protein CBD38_01515 [bacterium TMED178]|tara:strand:- start:9273 stop:10247 length:975 start_codon:yes stop_codon:yes gene_type:complete